MISRLADQKGFDLLADVLDPLLRLPLQIVILGTGEQDYHEFLARMAKKHPNIALFLTFNVALAQKIYAGSDMFLMPSRFEPCGLGQLIAMRYGSIPLVRDTGGLADTVENFDPATGTGRGFVFERYDSMDLFATVVRAIETYKHKTVWRQLCARNMKLDFSWSVSAPRYVDLYEKAVTFQRADALVPVG